MSPYIKSKKFHKSNHNRGLFLLNILFILIIFCLIFSHVIQVNSLVSYTYKIRSQEEYFNKLKEKNQKLGIEIAQLQSPVNLEEIIQSLGMIETGNIVYLDKEKAVAVRQ